MAVQRLEPSWRTDVRFHCLVLLIAVVSPCLQAQVFEVNGGASSLYQAQGGTLSAKGPGYDASLSGGVVAGRLVGGANFTKMIGRSTYIVGDDYVHFVLPTDIFDTSHYLVAVGGGVKANVRSTDVFAFAGATSNTFDSPLFEGVRAESPAGILFLSRPISDHLTATSNMVFSSQTTAIEGLDWKPEKYLEAALAGGAGANQPYGAASFDLTRPRIDVKAAYIEAGSQFHRVAVAEPLTSEPDRENVLVTVRPTAFLTFSAGRNNFLSPVVDSQTEVRSGVDNVSGAVQVAGTGISASLYHSTYMGNSNDATDYTASRDLFTRIHATASYLESRPSNAPRTQAFVSNLTERLTPRLDVSQLISNSQGQTTVSFGGGFLSNPMSITAEYQTYYVPERNSSPFEQALILDVQLHLIQGIMLHGASFVAPDGSLRYTADTQAVAVRSGRAMTAGDGESNLPLRESIGNMQVTGTVRDGDGHPVAGAALMIDGLLIYANDDGAFCVRERKTRTHQLTVLVDQFLNGGAWRVVSAPATVQSTSEGNAQDTVIVVERVAQAGG
jgi:hypothetical protein